MLDIIKFIQSTGIILITAKSLIYNKIQANRKEVIIYV